jgi:tetratricopeptide (TPR) repeat protein
VIGDYAPIPRTETISKAKSNATRALTIDERQAEAHAVLGAVNDDDWDWTGAEREFERALEIDPNSARAHVLYGIHLEFMGKMNEVFEQLQRAIELDPLNLNALDNLAEAYIYARQFDKTIEQSKKVLEIDPTFAPSIFRLGGAYRNSGNYDRWLEEWERAARLSNDADMLTLLDAAKREYPKSGYFGALRRMVALEVEQAKHGYVDPAWIAGDYAILGDKDSAFRWLEKAYSEKSRQLAYFKVSPRFDALRNDSRYTDLLRRMGLPQ